MKMCRSTKAHKASLCRVHHAYEERISHNTREVSFYFKKTVLNAKPNKFSLFFILNIIYLTLPMSMTPLGFFTKSLLQKIAQILEAIELLAHPIIQSS